MEQEAKSLSSKSHLSTNELVDLGNHIKEKTRRFIGSKKVPSWVTFGLLDHYFHCDNCKKQGKLENMMMSVIGSLLLEVDRLNYLNDQLEQTIEETVPQLLDEIERSK